MTDEHCPWSFSTTGRTQPWCLLCPVALCPLRRRGAEALMAITGTSDLVDEQLRWTDAYYAGRVKV